MTKTIMKLFSLLSAVLFLASPALAQEEGGGLPFNLKFGLKVGYQNTDFKGMPDYHELAERKSGLTVGAYVNASMKSLDWVALNLEFLYAQQGANNANPELLYIAGNPLVDNKVIDLSVRTHSFELPVTAKISVPGMDGFVPYLNVGASFIFVGKADARFVRGYRSESFTGTSYDILIESYDDVTSRIDNEIAPIIGVGVDGEVAGYPVNAELRYKFAMQDLNTATYLRGFRSEVITLTVGVGLQQLLGL